MWSPLAFRRLTFSDSTELRVASSGNVPIGPIPTNYDYDILMIILVGVYVVLKWLTDSYSPSCVR